MIRGTEGRINSRNSAISTLTMFKLEDLIPYHSGQWQVPSTFETRRLLELSVTIFKSDNYMLFLILRVPGVQLHPHQLSVPAV